MLAWEFPGGPGVRTQCFHCGSPGSISGQGIKILQAWQCGKKKKKKSGMKHEIVF